jgi:Transposase IS66 family
MSKRRVASFCTEVLRVPMALGEIRHVEQTVATALEPPVQEARTYVPGQDANVDETSWRQQQQRRARLWVVVTQGVSVFCIRASRGAKVLGELLGGEYGGVLTSDRAKAYNGQPLHRRQIGWAHLRRDFPAMIDRGGGSGGERCCGSMPMWASVGGTGCGTAPGRTRRFSVTWAGCGGGSARVRGRHARCLPHDRGPLPRAAEGGGGLGDLRAGAGARPHEQRA